MPKYWVRMKDVTYYTVEIEADDIDDAEEEAYQGRGRVIYMGDIDSDVVDSGEVEDDGKEV